MENSYCFRMEGPGIRGTWWRALALAKRATQGNSTGLTPLQSALQLPKFPAFGDAEDTSITASYSFEGEDKCKVVHLDK